MTIYELHTNERTEYVSSTNERMRKAMYDYIREKRAKGKSLSEIQFCWTPIRISRKI